MTAYSIWMLEYAYVPDTPIGVHVYGRTDAEKKMVPFSYTLVRGEDVNILLDCGLNAASHGELFIKDFGIKNWVSPAAVLREVGLTPEDITHVILTHAHFDHMGGLELFPNARFFMQKHELTSWVETMTLGRRFRWMMKATDTGDMIQAVQLARDGRLVGLDGDLDDLFPGIDVRLARDTHTAGSQYVVIRNDLKTRSSDTFVYTGDLIYDHENLHGGTPDDPMYVPIGYALGSQTNCIKHTDDIMKAVGDEVARVLIPHDRVMSKLYPHRVTGSGHHVVEVALREGDASRVS